MQDTVFTKIIKGEIPSHKIYEDDKTFAFLDIHPVTEGHVLVISKTQVEFIWDLSPDDYQAVMDTVHKVGRRLREVMGVPKVGILVEGTGVPHTHVHIIPFSDGEQLRRQPDMSIEPDHEALANNASKIRF
ncbi:MAG: HIT domain-containing protein [Candidatus Microsaccharimonas sp.]